MPKEYQPQELSFQIGGYFGSSYSVEWANENLVYQADDEKTSLNPSQEEWTKFWQGLEELNVWDWERRYMPEEEIVDGTSWKIVLQYQGQKIESSGSNAYPNQFSQFCDLVEELCGGREFK